MTLKKILATVISCLGLFNGAYGASFSKVYVHSGSDVAQFPYYNYGAPAVAYPSAQLSQLTAAPLGSVLPLPQVSSYATPCVQPCIPTQPVASVPSAGLVAYKAPSVPVVVAKDEPAQPYEYSYVVFDEDTGDHKVQKELSNGVIVTGQYSFLQPDGYVREVQYTADDATGFNAVVRNFLPENSIKTVVVPAALPCDDTKPKSEAIKETPENGEKQSGHGEELPKKEESHGPEPVGEKHGDTNAPAPSSAEQSGHGSPTATEGQSIKAPEKEPAHGADSHGEITSSEVKEEKPPKSQGYDATSAERTVQTFVQPAAPPQLVPVILDTNNPPPNYVSYNQLLNCIQKMQNQRVNSPLTYVLLPSKPC